MRWYVLFFPPCWTLFRVWQMDPVGTAKVFVHKGPLLSSCPENNMNGIIPQPLPFVYLSGMYINLPGRTATPEWCVKSPSQKPLALYVPPRSVGSPVVSYNLWHLCLVMSDRMHMFHTPFVCMCMHVCVRFTSTFPSSCVVSPRFLSIY